MAVAGAVPDEAAGRDLARMVRRVCENALPSDRVTFIDSQPDGARSGSGGFRARQFPAVVSPRSVTEVSRLARACVRYGDGRVHLYPVSTGHNWGFGARAAVESGAVLVDLGQLRAVRDVDCNAGIAVVEPGVTQGELASRLSATRFLLNVTASSAQTSVIGNALDRGVGLLRQRSEDLIALEVVLADGSVSRIGRWPGDHLAAAPYGYQPGPGLIQVFVQSGLGIVTAAAVRLVPRPDSLRVMRFRFPAENLEAAVGYLAWAHRNRFPAGAIKVFSGAATAAYGGGTATSYRAYISVAGSSKVVHSMTEVLADEAARAGAFSEWESLDPAAPGESVAESAALRGYAGDPGANDAMLGSIFKVPAERIEQDSAEGWIFFTPVVPFTAAAIADAVRLLDREQVGVGDGLLVGHTLNILPESWVDMVVSIRFPRTQRHAERAHKLLDRLYSQFSKAGFPPYRLDIDHMAVADALRGDYGQESVLRRIKRALDPCDIISRGRYAVSC